MKRYANVVYNHELFEEYLEKGILKIDLCSSDGLDCDGLDCNECPFNSQSHEICVLGFHKLKKDPVYIEFQNEHPEWFI